MEESSVLLLIQLSLFRITHSNEGSACAPVEKLDSIQCFGLHVDLTATDGDSCRSACCLDSECHEWQFHPVDGCFRGQSRFCVKTFSTKAVALRGERLRQSDAVDRGNKHIVNKNGALGKFEVQWAPGSTGFSYSTFESIEPYVDGPETLQIQSDTNGETFLIRRHGPTKEDLDISTSCWSPHRLPDTCCFQKRSHSCWFLEELRERCCSEGVKLNAVGEYFAMYHLYISVTHAFGEKELRAWDSMIPKVDIDEFAFEAKRKRWRIGTQPPGAQCSYTLPFTAAQVAETGRLVNDGPAAIRQLIHILLADGTRLSRTFVNVGAGSCRPPDPLFHFLHADEAHGFAGIAVDSSQSNLEACSETLQQSVALIHGVNLVVNPINVATILAPAIGKLFTGDRASSIHSKPWPLDILVIDVDGCDCLVAEELMQFATPKVLIIEIAFHIPPPFAYSEQFDDKNSDAWVEKYEANNFIPTAGCSLTYALKHFRPYGLHLFRLTDIDAVFVHEGITPALEKAFNMTFPQDEFECYRKSRLWMQIPTNHAREWFFDKHPANSIGRLWDNITWAQSLLGRVASPFSLQY